jgi:hypothetical protein
MHYWGKNDRPRRGAAKKGSPAISERGRNDDDMSARSTTTKKKLNPEKQAPGWQIRCLNCDFTERRVKLNIRLKAAGRTYSFGRCPQCKRIRLRVIEKAPKWNGRIRVITPLLNSTQEGSPGPV